MNKIKSLAVAVTLAVAAGSAQAQIATGEAGNGELFLSVWDKVNAVSYVRDLGVTMDSFGTQNTTTAGQATFTTKADINSSSDRSWSAAGDAAWTAFTAGRSTADINSFVYDVYAMDTFGGTSPHAQRYLTTTNEDLSLWATTPATQQSSSQTTGFSIVNQYLDAINSDGTQTAGQGAADTTANGSGMFNASTSAYAGNGKLDNWANKAVFKTDATIGTALDFWYVTRNSGSASEAVAWQYGNAQGDATFTLESDGTLKYAVAAVPEAETWAMFGAGLLMVGAIARRRMAS